MAGNGKIGKEPQEGRKREGERGARGEPHLEARDDVRNDVRDDVRIEAVEVRRHRLAC